MSFDDRMLEEEMRQFDIEFVKISCLRIPINIDNEKEKAKSMLDTITTDMDMYIQNAMSVLDTQLTGKLGRKVIETLELAKRT